MRRSLSGPRLPEKSTMLPASVSKRAVPPSLRSKKMVSLLFLVVMKAFPAVLWFRNAMPNELELTIVASPAVLRLVKSSTPESLL